jgi:phytoene synthase
MNEPDSIAAAYAYCGRLARAQDKDHYIASLFAPAERRPWLWALYAFALEIGRVRAVVSEPMAGMIRLQWWLEALSGLRAEEAAANPVMTALQDAARASGVAPARLAAAVEARQDELYGKSAVGAVAAVFTVAARMLGAEGEAVVAAADDAAKAVTFVATDDPEQARASYRAFRARVTSLPEPVLPAFLTVALVPLRLRRPQAAQWRRQIAMLRAAWFGFPEI